MSAATVVSLEEIARAACACLGAPVRPDEIRWRAGRSPESGSPVSEFLIRGRPGILGSFSEDGSGRWALQVLAALRGRGFDGTRPHRVPEPLSACADSRVHLARLPAGCGAALDELIIRVPEGAEGGVRAAARWLVALHGSGLRLGASDHPWRLFGRLADELAALAAARPREAGRLNGLLERLTAIEDTAQPEETQIHGRFGPSQVFPCGDGACVSGLDLSRQSDPARDLAVFVQELRALIRDTGGGPALADGLTQAFLREYAARRDPALGRVGFFRAAESLLSLCIVLRREDRGTPECRAVEDFHVREFEAAASSVPEGFTEGAGRAAGDFAARAAVLMDPGLVERVVFPAVFGKVPAVSSPFRFEAKVPQEDRATGRVTVRYRFPEGTTVYGKVYPTPRPAAPEVMRRLREAGFAEGPYQVPEPLAFLPEHRLLLTAAVPGVPLAESLGKQDPEALDDLRRTARWLVKLHASRLRLGAPETASGSMRLLTVVRRLLGAAVAAPEARERLREMLRALERKAAETAPAPPPVQTHGSFHHEHVFLSAGAVTVIDLDKSRPADPARDLAEFLTMYRRTTFRRTGDPARADAPTNAFLDEYARRLPGYARSLPVHWGAAILLDLLRYRKRAAREGSLGPLVAFLERDYDAVLSGAFGRW